MKSYTAAKAAAHFNEIIESTANSGEPVRITRGKKTIAGFVSPEDLKFIQKIRAREGAEDILAADKAMKEYEKDRKTITWEKIKKKHGL